MRPDRRHKLLLGVLAVAVAVAGYLQWPRAASRDAGPLAGPSPVRATSGPGITAPEVDLEALTAERPAPGDHARNLFKFKPKAVPVAPPPRRAAEFVPPPVPLGPPQPPP